MDEPSDDPDLRNSARELFGLKSCRNEANSPPVDTELLETLLLDENIDIDTWKSAIFFLESYDSWRSAYLELIAKHFPIDPKTDRPPESGPTSSP